MIPQRGYCLLYKVLQMIMIHISNSTQCSCPHLRLTQTSGLLTPRTAKLQSRSIRNLHHLSPQISPFRPKERLRTSLPPSSITSQANLQGLNPLRHSLLLHPPKHVTRQLESTIIMLSPTFPKAQIPRTQTQCNSPLSILPIHRPIHRIRPVRWSHNRNMDIVFRGINMHLPARDFVDVRINAHVSIEGAVGADLGVNSAGGFVAHDLVCSDHAIEEIHDCGAVGCAFRVWGKRGGARGGEGWSGSAAIFSLEAWEGSWCLRGWTSWAVC